MQIIDYPRLTEVCVDAIKVSMFMIITKIVFSAFCAEVQFYWK